MMNADVIIVGAGVMGAATACELARRGARVTLMDQARLPNNRGASFDHSKVFRFAYPDPLYARLASEALKGWTALEGETGQRLLTRTGIVLLGTQEPSYESESYETLRGLGFVTERLSATEVASRYPQFNPEAFAYGVLDPSGAVAHAERAVNALLQLARQLGVEIIESDSVTGISGVHGVVRLATETGRRLEAERVIVAAGPWTRELLPVLSRTLKTTRQEVFYFRPPDWCAADFEPERFPVFTALDTGFYGFPIHANGAMKLANHNKGEEISPDEVSDQVEAGSVDGCRRFFRRYIRSLADADLVETRVCIYNNTPDDDFVIDWHPEIEGVLVVTGFSGHGFKFGPAVASIAADLATVGATRSHIERFRLARFGAI